MDIKIVNAQGGTHVLLFAPYSPDLPGMARALGGRWQASNKCWAFDKRDEQRVRDLAREVYGTDGTPTDTVTVQVALSLKQRHERTLYFAGREIATRHSRDEHVRLGDGVIVIEGAFDYRGGSAARPSLDAPAGMVLEIRDVPAGHVDLAADNVTIISRTAAPAPQVDTQALLAERERLLARVAEIDALLPAPADTQATTQQAAAVLGVSLRTVQRWAATGKVSAAKDTTGRWVITIMQKEQ